MMNDIDGTEMAKKVATLRATRMLLLADEHRRLIMAAVDADRWEDVPIEIGRALLDGLMEDLRHSTSPFLPRDLGRPPLPLVPRRDL